VDRSASGQEDLLIAFNELVSAPGSRHVFALALAAFIDLIVFLLAYSSGPYFFCAPQERWTSAGAAMDSSDDQVFTRNFLRKLIPSSQGIARVDSSGLNPGERQLCLLLVSKGHAAQVNEDGKLFYLLDQDVHEQMVESLVNPGLSLRASVKSAAPGPQNGSDFRKAVAPPVSFSVSFISASKMRPRLLCASLTSFIDAS
jgi:hypothetical protein